MKIVICGGGTAGWLAAYVLSHAQPRAHEITVIESSKIGISGAGEASSGLLYDVLSGRMLLNDGTWDKHYAQFDMQDFMEKVGGTRKYALKHINWGKEKGSYLAPIMGPETNSHTPDVIFNYVLSKFGKDKIHLASYLGHHYESNKMPVEAGFGFQFDAFKVGAYMREFLMKTNPTMKHIDAVINDVKLGTNGDITELILDDGQVVDGDFFIDCTGFKRVLAKKLKINWVSYADSLLVDRAMPFFTKYDSTVKEKVEPITTAEALSSGWMWRTPLQHRRGNGYVYSSQFLNEDQAQDEIEKRLGHKIEPLLATPLKFEAGRLEQSWKNNCLVTGMAASFIEPLEATSIHATLVQLLSFSKEYLTPNVESTVTDINIKLYNEHTGKIFDHYKDFVVFHYQGGRDDTEFWQTIKNDKISTPFVNDYIERAKYKIPTALHFPESWAVTGLWKWTLAGLGIVTPEQAKKELEMFKVEQYAEDYYKGFSEQLLYNTSSTDIPFEIFPKY
jgi:tryptophan halogenase